MAQGVNHPSYLWKGELVSWNLAWGKGGLRITFYCVLFCPIDFYNICVIKRRGRGGGGGGREGEGEEEKKKKLVKKEIR